VIQASMKPQSAARRNQPASAGGRTEGSPARPVSALAYWTLDIAPAKRRNGTTRSRWRFHPIIQRPETVTH
jgi:hypothetical protein